MEDCYSRLRSIGCSVETADALAPILIELSDCKREAFYLWAEGHNNSEVARILGINEITVRRLIRRISEECRKCL
jgi:DNA-directed RNA polymerase specialized sigma24 family protein